MHLFLLAFFILLGEAHLEEKTRWKTLEQVQKDHEIHEKMRMEMGYNDTNGGLNLRVSKGMYTRGDYKKIRVSMVTQDSSAPSGIKWDYSKQFTYMWTNNYLHTALVDSNPGGVTNFTINGQSVSVKVPADGKASRGIMVADVCFTQDNNWCKYGGRFYTFNRLTDFLNAASERDDIDYWYILGDIFYDNTDYWSNKFFNALSDETKAKISGMTLGNHDFWHDGSNGNAHTSDQLGIGLTQMWAADTMAAVNDNFGQPFDWSISPYNHYWDSPPPIQATNTIWWTKVGNVAFISWTGAMEWSSYTNYFSQACSEFNKDPTISLLFLLSHWDGTNLSCKNGMNAPDVLINLRYNVPECANFKFKMKYVDGHDHQNKRYQTGFKIGGMGMSGGPGQTGVMYTKTNDAGDVWVYYIEFQNNWGGNYFDSFLGCVKSSGLDNCLNRDGVYLWYHQPYLPQTCWDKLATNCYFKNQNASCGDRMEWLQQNSNMDFQTSYNQVVSDCGETCNCHLSWQNIKPKSRVMN